MKKLLFLLLVLVVKSSFSQIRIVYRTVFDKDEKELTNTDFLLNIEADERDSDQTTFKFSKFVKDSEFVGEYTFYANGGEPIYNQGHVGVFYTARQGDGQTIYIYMMDNYCMIYTLPEGGSSFSDAVRYFVLMDGE